MQLGKIQFRKIRKTARKTNPQGFFPLPRGFLKILGVQTSEGDVSGGLASFFLLGSSQSRVQLAESEDRKREDRKSVTHSDPASSCLGLYLSRLY